MTTVFIVRPFSTKSFAVRGKGGRNQTVRVDFDTVDRDLIQPALERNQLLGKTTGFIASAGNIRVDMFQMLIAYDLVIADISIDNANVFYELGIRHGLRPRGTILIRFRTPGKEVPFDLRTDRYIEYDRDAPAEAVDSLAKSIKETLRTMRRGESVDSPVFMLLPQVDPPEPDALVAVPRAFAEAVERWEVDASVGGTSLALLAEEAKQTPWKRPGLRLVGRAQQRVRAFTAARETWAEIRRDRPDDIEANLALATIYQRLGRLTEASQACRNVLANAKASPRHRADARSQMARNEKWGWVQDFATRDNGDARQQAISDSRLISAFEGYMAGFAEDLNDYYSGLNALALLVVIVNLAEALPEHWVANFPTERKAGIALESYREQLDQLAGAVQFSLKYARQRAATCGRPDEWLAVSEAQYRLVTSDNPLFVRNTYRAARNAGGPAFPVDSEARQVAMFQHLGLFVDNCREALAALDIAAVDLATEGEPTPPGPRQRVIVATGHRVDAPDRPTPRFPNTREAIDAARSWLKHAVETEMAAAGGGAVWGIAGAASGCDLLFHEVCAELGVRTKIFLSIPPRDYFRRSVADSGAFWEDKFNRLVALQPPIVLSDHEELPSWADGIDNYSVFQRGNIWILQDALLTANADVTLLALWNGKVGDGPGGTADMIKLAKAHGAKVWIQDTTALFHLTD